MEKFKKKYLLLLIIVILGIFFGIIFSNIINTNDQELVYNKLTTYFNNLKDDVKIDYVKNLIMNLKNNLFYIITIFILGFSIIGLLINNFILFFKSFILGFSIGSIINIYLYRGLVLSFIYIFPFYIINILTLIILTYYANKISYNLYCLLFLKKEIDFKNIIRKYLELMGIIIIVVIINTLLETFISPILTKLFSFLI